MSGLCANHFSGPLGLLKRFATGLVLATLALSGQAAVVMVDLGFANFGHLGNRGPRCQATSLVNSFQYLRTRYASIYGNTQLIQGTLAQTRDLFADGWTNAAGIFRPGALGCGAQGDESFWEHKNLWINDFAPGTTVIKAMVDPRGQNPAAWNFRQFVVDAIPSADFLIREITHGEDVEVAIEDAAGAHMVTFYKFTWSDDDNDGQWDPTEGLSFNYIDPNNPNAPLSTANVVRRLDGRLEFLWSNGNNPAATVTIRSVFSESPRVAMPEPSVLALVALALVALRQSQSWAPPSFHRSDAAGRASA